MGYLFMLCFLNTMVVYGCVRVISETCDANYQGEFGYMGTLFHMVKCQPWVAWVAGNAGFHLIWVSTLTICQSYQVSFSILVSLNYYYSLNVLILSQIVILAMTTNERMNLARYVHFHTSRRGFYDSPFNRGYWQNLVDFAEFRCLGFLRPIKDDWYNTYDTEDFVGKVKNAGLYHKEAKSCCRQPEDREPLLTV